MSGGRKDPGLPRIAETSHRYPLLVPDSLSRGNDKMPARTWEPQIVSDRWQIGVSRHFRELELLLQGFPMCEVLTEISAG